MFFVVFFFFFRLEQTLSLPHLPDMLFHQNVVRLTRTSNVKGGENSDIGLEFNPLDALATVNDHEDLIHVAMAKEWIEARLSLVFFQKTWAI